MRITHPAAGCGLTTTTTLEGHPMIARNYRRYPDALKLQLELKFRTRRPQRPHQKPSISAPLARLRYMPQPAPKDAEEVPIGSLILTPSGKQARVEGYRGFKRDIRVRLVCRYVDPENKRFDVVLLAPELVVVIEKGRK